MAATALAYGAAAWARILQAADRVMVVRLLGEMLSVVLEWLWDGASLARSQGHVDTSLG